MVAVSLAWIRLTGAIERFLFDPAQPNGINNSTVLSLYEDSAGHHVDRYVRRRAESLRPAPRAHGSRSRNSTACRMTSIYGIMPDARGNLWLPTNKGLARYTPATGNVKVFDMTDGLQGNEFNQGAHQRTRRGEFLLGGINGFNAFFPDSIADNRVRSPGLPHKLPGVRQGASTPCGAERDTHGGTGTRPEFPLLRVRRSELHLACEEQVRLHARRTR